MNRKSEEKTIYEEIARLQACIDNVWNCINDDNSKLSKNKMYGFLSDLRVDMAWSLLDAGEPEKALELYDSIPWKTHAPQKYLGMSRAFIDVGQYETAIKLFEKGLKGDSESLPLWNNLGNLYHKKRDFLISLKYFEKALEIDPEDAGVLTNKGNALYGLACYEQSLEIFQDLAARYRDNPHHIDMLGWCHLSLGYPEKAAQYFKKHIDTDFETTDTYNGLYWAYVDMGLRNDALDIIQKGINRYPTEDPQLYVAIGHGYCWTGWTDGARDILTKGLEIFPDDQEIKDMLSQIDDHMNDPDKGKKPPVWGLILVLLNKGRFNRRA